MKKLIRLTEGDLHRIVKNSVNRILSEVRYSEPDSTMNYNYYSEPNSTMNNSGGSEMNNVQPSLKGETEWNPTEEDIRDGDFFGPEWSRRARAIGGHHKVGDIVRTVKDHGYGQIPKGSIVKVTDVDNMTGYNIIDINTGKEWGELGWII